MKMVFHYLTQSPAELDLVIQDLRSLFTERVILLLEGPVGAGKTETVKALTKSFGITEVASPSFAIHHHYETPEISIDHLDLYRLESEEDLESTGFWDLFGQESGLIIIEWSDRLTKDFLPLNWKKVLLKLELGEGQNARKIEIYA